MAFTYALVLTFWNPEKISKCNSKTEAEVNAPCLNENILRICELSKLRMFFYYEIVMFHDELFHVFLDFLDFEEHLPIKTSRTK